MKIVKCGDPGIRAQQLVLSFFSKCRQQKKLFATGTNGDVFFYCTYVSTTFLMQ